jgi:hypothetical protein
MPSSNPPVNQSTKHLYALLYSACGVVLSELKASLKLTIRVFLSAFFLLAILVCVSPQKMRGLNLLLDLAGWASDNSRNPGDAGRFPLLQLLRERSEGLAERAVDRYQEAHPECYQKDGIERAPNVADAPDYPMNHGEPRRRLFRRR